ncbi:M14 family zinc carboxypeptidase [Xanthovirga aplysinae]|uniref:M14 family zinc carboxypeptidase n=1 Tax=Xanthovirga aplysinae TaxID=2529853 RepID=UPI001CA40BF7|nr:M14 family zinc carboxypeptidase [Xanthovirga aplysinae]
MQAQQSREQDYYLPMDISYDPNVPTPEEVLGYQVGDWHVRPDQIYAYFKALAKNSDRVTLEHYGKTHEDRPLIVAVITSSQNHRKLEEIRKAHVRLTKPSQSGSLDISNMPVVVYQGFSVHGNEPSGANASLLYAYYLAAVQGNDIEKKLKNVVVLLDPMLNPDGIDRYAQRVNRFNSPKTVADPNDMEHREDWPSGRTNHYWFDLNRDYLLLQQPESQGRIKKFYEWRPNIVTDHHQMGPGSTFFMQPGVPSRIYPSIPKMNIELTHKMAGFHSKGLDEIGTLYFTEEGFDDYYPGRGPTFGDLNGAVASLFEQGASRGQKIKSPNGIVNFPFTIKNQLTTAFTTFESALALREEFLQYQRDFYTSALELGKKDHRKGYVFGTNDKTSLKAFNAILLQLQVEVQELQQSFKFKNKVFEAGNAYAVSLNQAQYRLINSLFDKTTEFTDSLFYDVSAWTLPLAFNIDYATLDSRNFNALKLGKPLKSLPAYKGGVFGGESDYAYVFKWEDYYAPKFLNHLLDAGLRTKVATKPFSILVDNKKISFENGSIMVPVSNQVLDGQKIFELLNKLAMENGIDIFSVNTGLTPKGIDLGSRNFSTVERPKIALLAGRGVTTGEAGEVWHLLAERYHTDLVKIDLSYLSSVNLERYNTIVMVNGSYRGIDSKVENKLKLWVNNGGTIIALKGAAKWLTDKKFIDLKWRSKKKENGVVFNMKDYYDVVPERGAQKIGGAIFETILDPHHPLGYGYTSSSLPIFKNDVLFAEPTTNAYATPLAYTKQPLMSGYISQKNAELISGAAAVTVHSLGKGKIIAFGFNPNFRAFWYGTNRLFMNAIYFGKTINSSTTEKLKKKK